MERLDKTDGADRLRPPPMAADLYGDIEPTPAFSWRDYLPGLGVVAVGTLSAAFLSDRYGAPLTLMALLIGFSLNFLTADPRLAKGIAFASREMLRWGIVLAGVRITVAQIAGLGLEAFAAITCIVLVTIGSGLLAARRLGFSSAFGLLAGGAVGICGASAALALTAILGEKRINQAQLTLVLVGISALSALAMVLYPVIAHVLEVSEIRAGFLLGASIHDVAQALGAGYSYSDESGNIAAIVKLTRVALLAPVLVGIALCLPRGEAGRRTMTIPWFVAAFFLVAGVNSLGVIPAFLSSAAENGAGALLAAAITATAMRSPLGDLLKMGIRPLLLVIVPTITIFILALAAATWVIS